MMISSENAGKVTNEDKLFCAVCRKSLNINSTPCQFCRCWLLKRCSGIRVKLKDDSKFKCQTCVKQETDITKDFPGIELNDQSLETMEKLYYLDSVITRIRMDGVNSEI